MRRRLVTFLLAALAAITIAVPLWAALRSERSLIADRTGSLQVHHTRQAPRPVAEAATLVLTGIMLIGLASAVRRTS
jgi:drug/metabolite transporter superfamily protein YnfA